MGFINWVMHGLGFEDKEKDKEPRAEKEKKVKKNKNEPEDKYANFNLHEHSNQEKRTENVSATGFNSFGIPSESNIIMYEPKNYGDIQKVVDYLKQGQSIMINLEGIADADRGRILDFLSGAIYGLNGSIHRWKDDLFVLTPEGHKILMPEGR
jgi:cell division inhibitor SepF